MTAENPIPPTAATLSIVVPTHNRADRLPALLDRLLAEPAAGEVVIVDDASTDATAQLLAARSAAETKLVVVNGRGEGPLAARVVGVQRARGDVVLLLDDDVLPDPGIAAGHLRHHRAHADLLVLGYMPTTVPHQRSGQSFTTRLYAAEYEGRCASYEEDASAVLRHLWMGNLSLPRERLLEVTVGTGGPLPPFRHEDQEIGLRLAALGVTAVFDRSLHGTHEHRRTLPQFRRDSRLDGAGIALLDRDRPGLYGEGGHRQFRAGLPAPLAALLAASRPEAGYRAVSPVLSALVRGLGAVGALRPQLAAARLLRRVEFQRGYLLESTGRGDPRA